MIVIKIILCKNQSGADLWLNLEKDWYLVTWMNVNPCWVCLLYRTQWEIRKEDWYLLVEVWMQDPSNVPKISTWSYRSRTAQPHRQQKSARWCMESSSMLDRWRITSPHVVTASLSVFLIWLMAPALLLPKMEVTGLQGTGWRFLDLIVWIRIFHFILCQVLRTAPSAPSVSNLWTEGCFIWASIYKLLSAIYLW